MKLSPLACALCLAGSALWGAAPNPTPEDACKFIDDVEQKLLVLGVDSGRADWVRSTDITYDTELLATLLDERAIKATVQYAKESTKFERHQARSGDCAQNQAAEALSYFLPDILQF